MSHLLSYLTKRRKNIGGHQAIGVTTTMKVDLLYEVRTGEEILLVRHQENGFQLLVQMTIHLTHLKLVLEVRYRTKSPNND